MAGLFRSRDQESLRLVRDYLSVVQELAEPVARSGDLSGGCRVWECALRLLVATMTGLRDLKAEFQNVLGSPDPLESPQQRWNTLREVVRPILDGGAIAARVTANRERPLPYIRQFIDLAIQIGAPAYNQGDYRGCSEVYACTARFLLKTVAGADGAKARLGRALQDWAQLDDPSQQAWTMRHGFDDVLAGAFGDPVRDASPKAREYIFRAIQVGAPAYNQGDHEGCYTVYANTALLILETVPGAPQSKELLREALRECEGEPGASERAWILRRAFDRILAEESGR